MKKDEIAWVVVIGAGVWAKCYGPFDSHDDVMRWVRVNQFSVEEAHPYPVTKVQSASEAK